jgi:DNA-binding response OmpR family regulator
MLTMAAPTILIVDDEPCDIDTIRRILESRKYNVVAASDYDTAMEAFAAHGNELNLALLDVTLPGKNGIELAKQLLALKPDLRVLFISGHAGASVVRFLGMDAADEHFLQKPFDTSTLLARVQQALTSNQPLQLAESAADGAAFE